VCNKLEPKNLIRQNFVQSDLGKPKAAVLANRYGKAFNVQTYAVMEKVTGSNSKFRMDVSRVSGDNTDNSTMTGSCLVVICTDSAESRRQILECFTTPDFGSLERQPFIIDSGNEDTFGQVTFFNAGMVHGYSDEVESILKTVPEICPALVDVGFIPMDPRRYASIEDRVGTGSCADLDQTLAINAMMATTITSVIQAYYYGMPFTYNTVSLSMDGGNQTTYNTAKEFLRRAISPGEVSSAFSSRAKPLPREWAEYGRVQEAMLNGEDIPVPVLTIDVTCDPDGDSITFQTRDGSALPVIGEADNDSLYSAIYDLEGSYDVDEVSEAMVSAIKAAYGPLTAVNVTFISV